MRGEWTAD